MPLYDTTIKISNLKRTGVAPIWQAPPMPDLGKSMLGTKQYISISTSAITLKCHTRLANQMSSSMVEIGECDVTFTYNNTNLCGKIKSAYDSYSTNKSQCDRLSSIIATTNSNINKTRSSINSKSVSIEDLNKVYSDLDRNYIARVTELDNLGAKNKQTSINLNELSNSIDKIIEELIN